MKSVKFSALVAVAVIAASCAKEGTHSVDESNKVALEPMCIEASDESQTKTVLNGKSVYWTKGDEIAVYSNMNYNTGNIFAATDINGNSASATFNGEVPVGTTSFFAVYPPEKVVSVSAEGVTVNIPAKQTPAAGTFAEEHNITVAQGTKTPGDPSVGTITFNNVCSYVKFTVPAYVSDVTEVKITSGNAIAGDLTVDYTGENPKYTIAADGAKTTISMSGSFGAGETFIFVIAPGFVSNFRIDITAKNGNWTRTVSNGFEAKAGVPVKLGTVDFKQVALKAEAKHVYKNGILVGTDLSVNLGLDGFLKYASNLEFNIFNKDGYKVRSYSSVTVANPTVSLSWQDQDNADYPYLPQGAYTIKGSYTRPDGSTQTISDTFTVTEKPKFTVNAKGMTSYSYYSENNIKQANDCQAETIYGIGGTATISPTLLEKYPYSASYTLDGIKTTDVNKAGQSWGQHTITATYTFDGVTVTSPEHICHITGLPCTLQPNTTDWTATVTSDYVTFGKDPFDNDCIQLKGNNISKHPKIQSKSFNIPSNINISTDFQFYISVGKPFGIVKYYSTLNEYIGGNLIKVYQRTSTGSEYKSVSINGDLTSSKPYIEFEAETTTSSNDNSYSRIYTVTLNYGALK